MYLILQFSNDRVYHHPKMPLVYSLLLMCSAFKLQICIMSVIVVVGVAASYTDCIIFRHPSIEGSLWEMEACKARRLICVQCSEALTDWLIVAVSLLLRRKGEPSLLSARKTRAH